MYTIALIEDDENDYITLKSFFERFEKESESKVEFRLMRYKSALTFLSAYDISYDMVFMDIMLPDIDGMEASRKLRKIDSSVTLLFVTNMAQFAVNGYEVNAFDYIVKPVSYANFALKLKRALAYQNTRAGKPLRIRIGGGFAVVNSNDIKYIETAGHDLVYHAKSGDYTARGSLKTVQESLPSNFMRCNSCYLVNLHYVTKVQGSFVYLGDTTLQISQHKRTEFIHALNNYLNNDVTGD